jgi:hypothetical protein
MSRRRSNDLAASARIVELQQLQKQLSSMIQDDIDEEFAPEMDNSVRSSRSLPLGNMESSEAPRSVRRTLSLSEEQAPTVGTDIEEQPTIMPRFAARRRASNDIAASARITELRELQNQLSSLIQDEDDAYASGMDNSNHSRASHNSISGSTRAADPHRLDNSNHSRASHNSISGSARDTHPRIISSQGSGSESDIESGVLPTVNKPIPRHNIEHVLSSETLATMTCHSATTSEDTKSDDTSSNINQSAPSVAVDSSQVEEPKSLRGRLVARTQSFKLRSKSSDRSVTSNDSQLSAS